MKIVVDLTLADGTVFNSAQTPVRSVGYRHMRLGVRYFCETRIRNAVTFRREL